VAAELGYASQSAFSAMFRKALGVPPGCSSAVINPVHPRRIVCSCNPRLLRNDWQHRNNLAADISNLF
jgi:AraC-like DNA-binding protein